MSSEHDSVIREKAIRQRACSIWERRGRPIGEDLDIWLTAERQYDYEFPRSWADVVKDDVASKVHSH
jgi:hypothetical protein